MFTPSKYGLAMKAILLPKETVDCEKWAVIACDQFTSDRAYWEEVEARVGDSPSTLRLIYPEAYMGFQEPRPDRIAGRMREYRRAVLSRAVDGFVLVERETTTGNRLGLVCAIDLEAYDYLPGAGTLIRATEGTVVDRLPPRIKIRKDAPLELPHVMLLTDDPGRTLIEPLFARREALRPLYDFQLMMGGGRLRGWAIERVEDFDALGGALDALLDASDGFLFAVGDGNHSLATARACWLEAKKGLAARELANHPKRYALVELCNLHDPALVFEPIHRAVFGAECAELTHDFMMYLRGEGMSLVPSTEESAQLYLMDEPLRIENARNPLPLQILQPFLDGWIEAHPGASIDYIHGTEALGRLDACRVRLTPMDKFALFPAVRKGGSLPRKTFSMGEAQDKRYYMECANLTKQGE